MWWKRRRAARFSFLRAYKEGIRQGSLEIPKVDEIHSQGTLLQTLEGHARGIAEVLRSGHDKARTVSDNRFERAKSRYEDVWNDFSNCIAHHGLERIFEGWPYLSSFVYYTILFGLAIGEMPMNVVVFRIFGQQEIYNWILAAVLAVILPLCAHLIGDRAKQLTHTITEIAIVVLVLILVLAGLLFIGELREEYLRRQGEPADPFRATAFVVIQYLLFVAATVAAYAHGCPWPRRKLQGRRKRLLRHAIEREVLDDIFAWQVKYWRNGVDRIKDVYVGANLFAGNETRGVQKAPLVFYTQDYDDIIV